MGAEYIDYIIADRIVIPEESVWVLLGKNCLLPNSYHVNDGKRSITDRDVHAYGIGIATNGFCVLLFQQELQNYTSYF